MDGVNIFLLIGAVGTICSIIFGYIGYKKGIKEEYTEKGGLHADITYIKKRTDDVLLEQKDTNRNMNLMNERLTRVEESSKQAHKRIDTLERGQ